MSLYQYRSAPTCDAAEDNFFMIHIFEYLKLVSYCVVPFVIVITLNVAILVRINKVYTNAAMRREGGLRDAAAVYRHQTPLVALGPPSTPLSGNADDAVGGVVWPQRQHFVPTAANSALSSTRHESPLNVQKLRQRRLTRMLLFISFAWLALTAPFTLHSFLPEPSSSTSFSSSPPSSPSSSSSSAATAHFSKSALSVSTIPTVSQLAKSYKATNSTFDSFLYHDYHKVSKSMFTALLGSNHLHETATESFLAEEHHSYTLSTPAVTTSPPASIDPSRYLLVKTICFLLMYLNHAINFYLYCLTGKRFRKELTAMLNCDRLKLMCSEGVDETVAAAAVPAVHEMAVLNGGRVVHPHQQHAGRMPLNQSSQRSSTSSRTRSGRMMMMNVNPLRKSSSELDNERYS